MVPKAVLADERASCLPASRYLSEEEVLDTVNPFVQLLSGVVWLIRNGSIYINESQATECDKTQETGQGAGASLLFLLCFDLFSGGASIELKTVSGMGGTLSTEPPS